MTIDKPAMRMRYSEKPAPKCHLCGAVMSIQAAGAGGVTYGCTGRIDKNGEGYKFAEGRHFADDHYVRSRVTDYGNGGDPDVLALLDELEAAERERDNWRTGFENERFRADKLAEAFKTEHEQLLMANSALVTQHMRANWAEKRIAELEALTLSQAATDVLAERRRQVTAEGWTSEHDDQYEDGELIDAAACYAKDSSLWDCVGEPPSDWPWSDKWWKPSKNMRRNLIKACALILVEIERRDRAAGIGKGGDGRHEKVIASPG